MLKPIHRHRVKRLTGKRSNDQGQTTKGQNENMYYFRVRLSKEISGPSAAATSSNEHKNSSN